MAKKNPFKKQSAIDAAINIAIGGAANVAVDYAISSIDALATTEPKYIQVGKFILGAVGSTMVSDKMVKAALDGIAVVGVSELAKTLMSESNKTATNTEGTFGVPAGSIGTVRRRLVPGNRAAGKGLISGVAGISNFIG